MPRLFCVDDAGQKPLHVEAAPAIDEFARGGQKLPLVDIGQKLLLEDAALLKWVPGLLERMFAARRLLAKPPGVETTGSLAAESIP